MLKRKVNGKREERGKKRLEDASKEQRGKRVMEPSEEHLVWLLSLLELEHGLEVAAKTSLFRVLLDGRDQLLVDCSLVFTSLCAHCVRLHSQF